MKSSGFNTKDTKGTKKTNAFSFSFVFFVTLVVQAF